MLPILNQSLWRDEAFSVLLAMHNIFEIITLTSRDTSPPLYYIFLHYWILSFGTAESTIRTLSLLFHILSVVGVFFLGRFLIQNYLVSLLISISTLLNPFLLLYAFEARPYSLLACLVIWATYLLTKRLYILTSIFLASTIFTHNFGVFTCFSFFLFMLLHRYSIKHLVLTFSLPAITVLLWGSVIWHQWTHVASGFWIKPATSAIFIHSLEIFTQGSIWFPTQNMLYLFSLVLIAIAISYWIWQKDDKNKGYRELLLAVSCMPLLIVYGISALFVPIYHERYLIASVPLLLLFIGYSLWHTYTKNISLRIMILVSTTCYILLLWQASEFIVNMTTKPAINWGVSQAVSKAQRSDIIIPKDILNYLEVKYYVSISGKPIQTAAYIPEGKIPFYIGSILYTQKEIITSLPQHRRIWEIEPDGGYQLHQQ